MSETGVVKGAEFERRVRKLARSRNITCQFVAGKGKAATAASISATNSPPSRTAKKEIGRDLLAKMCADLKIDPHDL